MPARRGDSTHEPWVGSVGGVFGGNVSTCHESAKNRARAWICSIESGYFHAPSGATRLCGVVMRNLILPAVAAALAILPQQALAQVDTGTITADARVEKLLEEAGLNYTIDEDGDFRLEFALEDDRSQLVWISSKTASYEVLEVRDVWSVAFRSRDPLSAEVANLVLRKNGEMILGAWQVKKWGDDYVLAYAAQVAANADAASLESAAEAVVVTADELEKALTGKDEF